MLSHRREDCLREIEWNRYFPNDVVSVLDCWKFEGDGAAQENSNWRFLNLHHEQRRDTRGKISIEDKLDRWLRWKDEYTPLGSSDPAKRTLGGIRLIFCERANLQNGMSISKEAFLAIEREFGLHETTLPTFCFQYGTWAIFNGSSSTNGPRADRIHLVAKAHQKYEIMNCTLSLSYDVTTRWTTAFICGEGILLNEASKKLPVTQREQFLRSILSNHASWDNPFMLPFALFDTIIRRLDARADQIGRSLADLETEIGVTVSGTAGGSRRRKQWPEDIDTRGVTKNLHSESTEIIYLLSCCDWTEGYSASLLKAIEQAGKHAGWPNDNIDFANMQEHVQYFITTFSRVHSRYKSCQDRANLQINVLFNIVSQQATIASKRDTDLSFRVAKSSKQDAISVSTFTAITALFLPGSFIATMFSMSMFNWQAGVTTDGASSTPTTQSRYVVDVYWIFWVVTFPLTVLTIIGWRMWSNYANRKWLEELDANKEGETEYAKNSL